MSRSPGSCELVPGHRTKGHWQHRPGRHAQRRAKRTDLLERLAAAPALYDLTVNPLLLTMIANVHRYRGALPGSRADLYSEICQVMLYRRHQAKRQQPAIEIPGPDKETLLARLAFTMMTSRTRDLQRAQIFAALEPHLARLPGAVTGEDFLADVANNGLLVEREHHLYTFAHHTFGEYLAARYIAAANSTEVLIENVQEPWWRETALCTCPCPASTPTRSCGPVWTAAAPPRSPSRSPPPATAVRWPPIFGNGSTTPKHVPTSPT